MQLATARPAHRQQPRVGQAFRSVKQISLLPNARSRSLGRCHATRRATLLQSSVLAVAAADPRTLVNSVLSAYGLPLLSKTTGFQTYDKFENDYTFEYPKSWVIRANSQRPGIYASDFQTADKAVIEIINLQPGDDPISLSVSAVVNPGINLRSGGSDRGYLPSERSIKKETAALNGREYTYLQFPSETVTNSGYNIKRRNFAVLSVKGDRMFVLSASARSDQYNPEKAEELTYIVQSFRLR